MKLTIVYHIWKNTDHLEESLKSIFNQSDNDFEFILIDDNATSKVKNTVRSFDFGKLTSFQYVTYSQTLGHSSSYNDALKIARGNYIYYIGSDVVLLEHFVKTINDILNKYKGVEVISFTNKNNDNEPFIMFDKINEKSYKITKKSLSNKILSIDFLKKHNIRLNDSHYYPLLYIYAIMSHTKQWLSVQKELAVYYDKKSYSYNLNDIFVMNEYLINHESNNKFWKDNKEFMEYLMIIYVLKVYLARMSLLYKSNREVMSNSLDKANRWLNKYIPKWRTNKVLLKYDNFLSKFKFHIAFFSKEIVMR